jgi:hypothetical protein
MNGKHCTQIVGLLTGNSPNTVWQKERPVNIKEQLTKRPQEDGERNNSNQIKFSAHLQP